MIKKVLPYILIVVAFLIAGGIYLESTKKESSPELPNPFTKKETEQKSEQKDVTPAPEFVGITNWLNSEPLTMAGLRGKVVLIDFWTYSCINCIRTLPYVTGWYEKYKDQGLVIIGVHAPEFAFEKETANVAAALKRYNITYPVAQDNDYKTWSAYHNQYWPAHYLVDKNGNIVYTHFGEGKYTETENKIRELLGQEATASTEPAAKDGVRTPEIYFGLKRLKNLSTGQESSTTPQEYVIPNRIDENTFALSGTWQFDEDKATLIKGPGKIKLYFYASTVHIVAKSATVQSVTAKADDLAPTVIQIHEPDLYTVFQSDQAGPHVLEITIPEGGFEAFTFTFG